MKLTSPQFSSPITVQPALLLVAWLGLLFPATGQVIMDGTLGRAGALSGPAFQVTPDLGRQVGGNLFHSFSKLNLTRGESATFSGPASVQNVLARVTGGASAIDGTLRSTIPGANLYLLNPGGVMFGPNATVDVSGSFVVSTADYLKLTDGGRFDVRVPANSSLTAAPLVKFGFLSMAPAKITVDGSQLAVAKGQTISVVGGDIEIKNRAQLKAVEGAVNLTSVGATATEVTTVPDRLERGHGGNITISNPNVDVTKDAPVSVEVSGNGGGKLNIRGGNLTVDYAKLQANNTPGSTLAGKGIEVRLSGAGVLRHRTFLDSRTGGTGQSGPINFESGSLEMYSRSRISGSNVQNSPGNAGLVTVATGSLNMDGDSGSGTTAITSRCNPGSSGRAGEVTVTVAGLTQIRHSAEISASTDGFGNGGTVSVTSGSMVIERAGAGNYTGIASNTTLKDKDGKGGHAGDVIVSVTGLLEAFSGGQIASSTAGFGKAGNVKVTAGALTIDGSNRGNNFTGLSTESKVDGSRRVATGDAGTLTVEVAGALRVINGGAISSSTAGGGNGGFVSVTAGKITLLDGGLIAAKGSSFATVGNAGQVRVTATDSVVLRGNSSISSQSEQRTAGGVVVNAGRRLEIYNSTITTESKLGRGGDLTLLAIDRIHADHARIASQAGGTGGNIFIDPVTVSLNQTRISANAVLGDGGNIKINTGYMLRSPGSQITASSEFGLNGQISVLGPSVDLSGSLVALAGHLLGAESRLPERCAVRLSGDLSSFISVGRGGVPLEPGDYQPMFLHLEDRREKPNP